MSCSSVLCLFRVLSVLLIATCGRLSWPALLSTFGKTIKIVIVLLTDRSISKSFLCHDCVVLYTVYVFYVRTAPVRSQHVAPRCTFRKSSEVVAAAAVADSDAPEVQRGFNSFAYRSARSIFLGRRMFNPLRSV